MISASLLSLNLLLAPGPAVSAEAPGAAEAPFPSDTPDAAAVQATPASEATPPPEVTPASEATPPEPIPAVSTASVDPVIPPVVGSSTPRARTPAPGGAQPPLPPPAPPVDPTTIAEGPWRGVGWLGMHVVLGGPLDQGVNFPSSSRVLAFGWGFNLGFRAKPWLGFGLGYHRQPHDLVNVEVVGLDGGVYLVESTGYLNSWELLIVRLWAPTPGRVQPWVDFAGGLSEVQEAHETRPGGVGGQFRVGMGVDFWIQQQISIDLSVNYRLNSVGSEMGHLLNGVAGVGFHW